MTAFNIEDFRQQCQSPELIRWLDTLMPAIEQKLRPDSQRNFPGWLAVLAALPDIASPRVDLQQDAITTVAESPLPDVAAVKSALLELSPWRKGPFQLHGIKLDCEWRCDWKWQRLASHINLSDKTVLDVGSGNGYYSLRMLGAGARQVIGLDTSLLFCTQFQAITRFTSEHRATVLPLGVEILIDQPFQFETLFSMGVLYHRRQPIDHLVLLHSSLCDGGELVLETLILHGHTNQELIPEDRYANMRNVWTVPSLPTLFQQLEIAGFSDVRCIDISRTTTLEQRPTEWMPYKSLVNALDPEDSMRTVEGLPGPLRAVIVAKK